MGKKKHSILKAFLSCHPKKWVEIEQILKDVDNRFVPLGQFGTKVLCGLLKVRLLFKLFVVSLLGYSVHFGQVAVRQFNVRKINHIVRCVL